MGQFCGKKKDDTKEYEDAPREARRTVGGSYVPIAPSAPPPDDDYYASTMQDPAASAGAAGAAGHRPPAEIPERAHRHMHREISRAESGFGDFGRGSTPGPHKDGWMTKKGPVSILGHAWQRRWFVLSDYELRYYIKQQPPVPFDEPRGTIHLKDITRVQSTPDVWKEPGLQLFTAGRTHVFQTKTKDERDAWVAALEATCGEVHAPAVLKRSDSKAARMLVGS